MDMKRIDFTALWGYADRMGRGAAILTLLMMSCGMAAAQSSASGGNGVTSSNLNSFDASTFAGSPDICVQIQNAMTAAVVAGQGSAGRILAPVSNKAYCSVIPAISTFHGTVQFMGKNGSRAIIYTSVSWTGLPSGIAYSGTGAQGSTITNNVFNVQVKACNPVLHDNTYPANATNSAPCAAFFNSTTNMPQSAITSITAAAAGTATITLPGALSGTPPSVFAGRLLCVSKDTASAVNAACWEIKSEPAGNVYTVNSTSMVVCAASCGTAFLDTPIVNTSSTTPNFFIQFADMSFDCTYVYACGGPVDGGSQEGTRWSDIQVYNATVYGFRQFVGNTGGTNAYGGNAGGGSHSGPSERVFFNYQSETCEIFTAGCPGTDGTHSGAGFLEPAGTFMACGDRTVLAGGQAILAYSSATALTACQKNMVGFASDGLGSILNSNSNSFYGINGLTVSLKDVFNTGSHVIMPEITEGIGIFDMGPTNTFLNQHVEFAVACVEAGGNAAINETWIEDGTTTVQGLTMIGGDDNNCSSQVFDLGSANGTTNVMNVTFENISTTAGNAVHFVKNNLLTGEDCTNGAEKNLYYVFAQTQTSARLVSDCSTAKEIIPQAMINVPSSFTMMWYCTGALNAVAGTYMIQPGETAVTSSGCLTLTTGTGTSFRSPITTAAGKCTIYANGGANATAAVTVTLNNTLQSTSASATVGIGSANGNATAQTLAITANDTLNISITIGTAETWTNPRVMVTCW